MTRNSNSPTAPKGSRRHGFSLIEIMLVTAIVGVLVLISGWGVIKTRRTARIKRAETDIALLHDAVKALMWDTGYWPGSNEKVDTGAPEAAMWDLSSPQSDLLENFNGHANWDGPYIDEILDDPWGNPYFLDPGYHPNGHGSQPIISVIGSFGPSGTGQTDYDKNNITVEISP